MELFDFIKIIFTNSTEYKNILPGEKRKHFFMCQRRFAINFPLQANALQHLKINQAAVIDFWQRFLTKQYRYVPSWMYIKGVKKSQIVKEQKLNISNELIKEYCIYMRADPKSVKDAILFYPDKMKKELEKFKNIISQK